MKNINININIYIYRERERDGPEHKSCKQACEPH